MLLSMKLSAVMLVCVAVMCTATATLMIEEGEWDGSVLVAKSQPISPSLTVLVTREGLKVRQRSVGSFQRGLDAVARALHLVPSETTPESKDVCMYRVETPVHIKFGINDSASVFGRHSSLRGDAQGFLIRSEFSPPIEMINTAAPLGEPQTLFLHTTQAHRTGKDQIILRAVLSSSLVGEQCSIMVELRRQREPAKSADSSGGLRAPLVMLVLVVCVRLLPRYFLEKSGQIGRNSFRGKRGPVSMTAARRAQLMKQQADIIAQMKAEDAREAKVATVQQTSSPG